MKIFSAQQIQQWDAFTIEQEPIASLDLMERAAGACYNWIKSNFNSATHFIICCGSGNNGGDGLAIARMLHQANYQVSVYILAGKNKSANFSRQLERLMATSVSINFIKTKKDFPKIGADEVVIDALFGTGLNRPLEKLAALFVEHLNQSTSNLISIDIPSGLCADIFSAGQAIIKATHTLSFETNKLVFLLPEYRSFTGEVHLLSIGLDKTYYANTKAAFETIDAPLIQQIFKPRDALSHKYNFGHALLYAGSKNMMGAVLLCAKACLRAGAGLVTVKVAKGNEAIVHTALPEAITNSDPSIENAWVKKAAIAIGPGMLPTSKNSQLLQKILTNWSKPLVIDATALSLLKEFTPLLASRKAHPAILTPHHGEFEKLFGPTTNAFERMALASKMAIAHQCYIILKGPNTLIACPDGMQYINTTGNAGMATAGTGDALTGILCSLLSQGYSESAACLLGVYLHGLAGDLAAKKVSPEAMMASDLIAHLGEGFQQIKQY